MKVQKLYADGSEVIETLTETFNELDVDGWEREAGLNRVRIYNSQGEILMSLNVSSEAEAGSAGEQPAKE